MGLDTKFLDTFIDVQINDVIGMTHTISTLESNLQMVNL